MLVLCRVNAATAAVCPHRVFCERHFDQVETDNQGKVVQVSIIRLLSSINVTAR